MSQFVISEGQHYSNNTEKKRRALLVCSACHAKKIKCDLQDQRNSGHDTCKNCMSSGRSCHVRSSKREKRNRGSNPERSCDPSAREIQPTPMGVDALLAADARLNAPRSSQRPPAAHQPSNSTSPLEAAAPVNFAAVATHEVPQSAFRETVLPSAANEPPRACQSAPLVPHAVTQSSTETSDMDTGFLNVYAQESQFDAQNQNLAAELEHRYSRDLRPDLEETFTDTYFEYCYPWCPVLDRDTLAGDISRSPLLANALALASSHIQPPLLPHAGPEAYYKRARTIFYEDEEADALMTLKSLCLFYWWARQSPNRVHRHSSWWWTSVIIRHAQQMNIHREPSPHGPHSQAALGTRRKIWWTAFARERLTSLCQSKPAIIDPNDCTIQQLTLSDFPPDPQSQFHGEIFIYWVRLCAIIGRIAKFLHSSSANSKPPSGENALREELASWIHSLPPQLRLPIETSRTHNFDRNVHQLHLFYLTTVIILHLRRSEGQLPQALPPAIIAASCTARILRDVLIRGTSRYLMAITCWHIGTSFIGLLQACRIPQLTKHANDEIEILSIAVKELQKMWASANVIAQGMERLRATQYPVQASQFHDYTSGSSRQPAGHPVQNSQPSTNGCSENQVDGFDWLRFFPFITKSTGAIAENFLSGRETGTATQGFPSPDNDVFHGTMRAQYQDLFDPLVDDALWFSNPNFDARWTLPSPMSQSAYPG